MSIESAKSFIEVMKTDKDFAQKVTECKDAESRMAFVKEAGFDFDANEIKAVREELSDENMDKVAGGMSDPSWYTCKPSIENNQIVMSR